MDKKTLDRGKELLFLIEFYEKKMERFDKNPNEIIICTDHRTETNQYELLIDLGNIEETKLSSSFINNECFNIIRENIFDTLRSTINKLKQEFEEL